MDGEFCLTPVAPGCVGAVAMCLNRNLFGMILAYVSDNKMSEVNVLALHAATFHLHFDRGLGDEYDARESLHQNGTFGPCRHCAIGFMLSPHRGLQKNTRVDDGLEFCKKIALDAFCNS